jgi:hypothetical protein
MKKFHRQMNDLSNPMPSDFDETAIYSDDPDAFDASETEDDLAVEHYLSVG